ncbi:glycosyltransferase [Flammeovirgaceae bacterium SG7u.111]|nr:glycosyltransferase [Flammeovirgaceae bacterium SG7u.132]WPO37068.1 glycosyltransferase [Flammeovirgaceae bacterium SG7u.111]
MKIAYLSTFYPFRGGIAQYNASLFRALEKSHEVKAYNFTVQYPNLLFPGTSQYVPENDNADPIPSTRLLNSINPLSYWKTATEIGKFAPDLLIIGYWMPFFGPSQGMVAKLLRKKGCKVISVINNLIPHEQKPGDAQFTNFFVKQNDGFVVMGESVKNDLLSVRPDAPFILHPHPIYAHFGEKIERNEALKKLDIAPDKKVILFFGLIRAYKGLDALIEAMGQLSDEYVLLIVGEAYESIEKYKKLIETSPNKEGIRLINEYVPDEEVNTYFSAADVNILPYRTATQSGVSAVAFHFDVPIIVTDKGSLKESVKPYGTGLAIPDAEPTLIANAIQEVFREGNLEKFKQNIASFKAKFTWANLAEEITTFTKTL